MRPNLIKKIFLFNFLIILSNSCAYFNTFYNANQYYEEAHKIRLEKDGQAVPITAMDKYGKAINKCKKVLKEFPQSKFRSDAILLMAKAQYFRSDYDLALENLREIEQIGSEKQIEEAYYWKALCKWKKGNLQVSMDELYSLLSNSSSKSILSKCHLSLAEISKELSYQDSSLYHLKKAAKFTQDRDEKGVIYGRLAEMAFELKQYDIAKDGYSNVIAHSLAKEKIENAHLQILKILRIQKEYRLASRKIKSLLSDDKFKRISGNLELELVNLYRAEGEDDEIENRLESIVNDYQRTEVSAEAYYQLGEIYSSEKWDLEKAKEYYGNVSKESNRSLFSSSSKSRVLAITTYQNTLKEIETINLMDSDNKEVDSTLNISLVAPVKSLPELYYQLADLEAFSFARYSESIAIFEKIILEFPDTDFKPKSIFALIFVYEQLNDSLKSQLNRKILLESYPGSEYASYLSGNDFKENDAQRLLFKESEELIKINFAESIEKFKSTLKLNLNSSLAAAASLSIGYYYDQESLADSALKYYRFTMDKYPNSEQSIIASERAEAISFALSLIKPDSASSSGATPN